MAAPAKVDTTADANLIEQTAHCLRELYQAEQANENLANKRVAATANVGAGTITYTFIVPVAVGDGVNGGLSLTPTDYFPA